MIIVMPLECPEFQEHPAPHRLSFKMGRTDIGRLLAEAFLIPRIG